MECTVPSVENLSHSSTPGEHSWLWWPAVARRGYTREGSYRVVSISSVIDSANTPLCCAWYVVRVGMHLRLRMLPAGCYRAIPSREGRKIERDEEKSLVHERGERNGEKREREKGRGREVEG